MNYVIGWLSYYTTLSLIKPVAEHAYQQVANTRLEVGRSHREMAMPVRTRQKPTIGSQLATQGSM